MMNKLFVLDQESEGLNKLRDEYLAKGNHIWEMPKQYFWHVELLREENDSSDDEESKKEQPKKI